MAKPYKKRDPGSGQLRWWARLKVGGEWTHAPLELLAPENLRLAQARRDRLQIECDLKQLSNETLAWLHPRTAKRLTAMFAPASTSDRLADDWDSARARYLQTTDAQDIRLPIPGKAKADEEHARYSRQSTIARFIAWAKERRIRFPGEPLTSTLADYLAYRLQSVEPGTIRTMDYPYLALWADWMARHQLCRPIDRVKVLEKIPPRGTPDIQLPSWEADLKALQFFHERRLTPLVYPGQPPAERSAWRKPKGFWSAWGLITVVRGLGCRPSEAIGLHWSTVDLEQNRVRFLDSKTGRHRTVPILFQWVKDSLVEMADRFGTAWAVCPSATGEPYSRVTVASALMSRICRAQGDMPTYHLKTAQKLWIRQLIHMGFPPHVIARWADHQLSVQERHYMEEDAYLPRDRREDYGRFGVLSEYGEKTRQHLASFSRDFEVK